MHERLLNKIIIDLELYLELVTLRTNTHLLLETTSYEVRWSTMLRNRIRLDCACAAWLSGGIDSATEYIKVKDEETCMNY